MTLDREENSWKLFLRRAFLEFGEPFDVIPVFI